MGFVRQECDQLTFGDHSFRAIRRALDPHGSYISIGHDAFGATGHRWLGSMPRLLGLVARSAVSPQLRGGSLAARTGGS